jgi:hypothetical protein
MGARAKGTSKPRGEARGGIFELAKPTGLTERHWIGGKKTDLPVYRIPLAHLYFNIENGRYADRMLLLRAEHRGVDIDPREERWKNEIEKMLAGEHRDTGRDKDAFKKLKEDLDAREQLRPGVALQDGGVLDGNRRLAALRRLWKETHSDRYAWFEAVILPDETTDEERWRIEAGLQLGLNERHDYTPINELLKVRQGLTMFRRKIADGELPATKSEFQLVADSIYGKTETDIKEMSRRLDLIDAYLTFIGKKDRYDLVGDSSEDFLEGLRIVTAAQNQDRPPALIAKLRAVLFFLIHKDLMDNWDLREIYHSLGGDPTKRGRKRQPNDGALQEFLDQFPEPRDLQRELGGGAAELPPPPPPPTKKGGATQLSLTPKPGPEKRAPAPKRIEPAKAEQAVERFLRTQEAGNKKQSLMRIAAGAKASIDQIGQRLRDPKAIRELDPADILTLKETLVSMAQTIRDAQKALK